MGGSSKMLSFSVGLKKGDGFFGTFGDDASLKGKPELSKICTKYLFWKLLLSAPFLQKVLECSPSKNKASLYLLFACIASNLTEQRNFFLYKLALSVLIMKKQSMLATLMFCNCWAPDLK